MDCKVIKITSSRVLEALPDAQYHTNSILPLWFEKKDGVLEFSNGKVIKTFEDFAEWHKNKTVVGPFREPNEIEMNYLDIEARKRR